jgi:hypothetical protein
MVSWEVILLVSTQHAQRRRDRSFAWRQDGAHDQQ